MSTDHTGSSIRVPRRIGAVRIATESAEDRAAAEAHARIAAEEARWSKIREETLETTRRQWADHFSGALTALAAERERLRQVRHALLTELEPHAVELSLAIARKLVAQELEKGRLEIRPVVETVLRELREPGTPAVVALTLNPEDYATLGAGGGLDSIDGVRVSADPSVARGACVVTTDEGRIVSDLEERVRSVRRALRLPVETEVMP